jgi:hypothetical protein
MASPCPVRIRVEAVRVNQGRDGVSPVVASMYCSPHPAALHIARAARLREFCLYDSALGEWLAEREAAQGARLGEIKQASFGRMFGWSDVFTGAYI